MKFQIISALVIFLNKLSSSRINFQNRTWKVYQMLQTQNQNGDQISAQTTIGSTYCKTHTRMLIFSFNVSKIPK